MNKEEIAQKIQALMKGRKYTGALSTYAASSIETSRSNYPVSNLLKYCHDSELRLEMVDYMTQETFPVYSIEDVHKCLGLLMDRWEYDYRLLSELAGVWYTAPKSTNGKKIAPLSIKVFLAVCNVIKCELNIKTIE